VRDPRYKSDLFQELRILRFELGIIRDKYFVSENRMIDFRRAIEVVAA
jgi:hypothetical protein